MSPASLTFIAVALVSVVPFLGLSLFLLSEKFLKRSLLLFVGFSTGGLLGDVLLHMIPEMSKNAQVFPVALQVLLGGILFSFIIEKLVHWRHCHVLPGEAHEDHHHHPVGILSLVGDVVHNLLDGLVIAGAFLASTSIGVSTALAVLFHEVPQEIGDSAVLLHSGYSRRRVLWLNLFSALTAFIGAGFVVFDTGAGRFLEPYLLPFAAGNFLYIAGADLIPELHKQSRPMESLLQLFCMMCGIGIMAAIRVLE